MERRDLEGSNERAWMYETKIGRAVGGRPKSMKTLQGL
jgi:hypothetical protein